MGTDAWRLARRDRCARSWFSLVVALLLGVSATPQARAQIPEDGFAVAPYLLDVTTDAATVAFHLRRPMPAEVRVEAGTETARFESSEPRRAHFVRLTGLSPGRTFAYQVSAGGGAVHTPVDDPSYAIRTAGLPGETFTFVVYGDPRPGESATHRHHRMVLEQIALTEPVFSLVLGDMVDDGSDPAQWEAYFALESELRRRSALYPVLGDNDHAAGEGRAADYFPEYARGRYHFEWGGLHFFGMNAWGTLGAQPVEELDADAEQLRWLEEQLSRPEIRDAPFRIVFLHDPIYVSRGRSAEVLRRTWAPLLARRGVDLVFASWHLYERSRHDGVAYIISGGAGAELIWPEANPAFPSQAEARRHHFCRVDVEAGALELRAVAEDGTVLDSLTLLPRGSAGRGHASSLRQLADRIGRELRVGSAAPAPELQAHLFSTDCSYCRRLLERELPRAAAKRGVGLRVMQYDLALPGAYDLLVAAGADFGRQDADLPALLLGEVVLGGEAEIEAGLDRELERFAADPEAYRARAVHPFEQPRDTSGMRTARFEAIGLPMVLAAGLMDGINPCAFTTVIFLLSYLSVTGGTRRRLLLVGATFTLAVFLTYLAIGLAFYPIARALLGYGWFRTVVHVLLLGTLAVLAALSALDAVRALRGKPTELSLKLPPTLQKHIRSRIRTFARNPLAGVSSAFSLGIVIAGLELACTGQIYLPIVAMIAEPRHRAAATMHLVAYNLAFILPLAVVFLLAAFGLGSDRLARFARRHVATVKIGLALLFAGLALVVAHNLGWTA